MDAEQIFSKAQEIGDPEARLAFIEGACQGDEAKRASVGALLAAQGGATEQDGAYHQANAAETVELASLSEAPGTVIGRYKILEKIGEGGMAVVYVAEQHRPIRRRVALKIIKPGMDTKQVIARFEAERQALALMDHPNIARALDAGATETGRPYFVMELVRGIPITQYCDHEKLRTGDRLDLFIQVCHAIQHAHQKGIVHRDIKPSNVMVTLHDGVPVPKVIDFGIAKATQQELTEKTVYTQFQQFIGTPAYMSPEQAEMSGLDIDTRSDIYSLGVLLYELLTGLTPFDTHELMCSGLDQMRKIIREREPYRPSTKVGTLSAEDRTTTALRQSTELPNLISILRGDLDWIAMKCLEKDRTRRYDTADALAMDLWRHLNNEPVMARPPSTVYRFQKAWQRNKVVYTAAVVVLLALAAGLGLATIGLQRAVAAQQRAEANEKKATEAQANETTLRERAQTQELAARQRAYASDMNVAKQALAVGNLGRALDLLNRQRPKPGQRDLRGWEWRYLWPQTRSDALFTLCRQASEVTSLAVSHDGYWLAIGISHRGGLSVWDLRTRRETIRLATHDVAIRAAFSPVEPVLAFTSVDLPASGKPRYTLHLWHAATRQMMAEYSLDARCVGLAFSGDGQTLVTSTYGGHITLRHIPDGTKLATYPSQQGVTGPGTTPFTVTPDLKLAAYGLGRERIRVLDLRDGRELWTATASTAFISALAFSPDGKTLASAAGFGEKDIRLWDVATGQKIGRLEGHGAFVSSLVFWPDGKKLASSSGDQTIRIWDVASLTCLDTLRGHVLEVYRVALLPDGKTLVTGGKDGTVCFWDTSVLHPRQASLTLSGKIDTWRFEPNGRSILTVDEKGVGRWTGADFQHREPLVEIRPDSFRSPVFSRDGDFLAVRATDDAIQIWDLRRRALRCQLTDGTGLVPVAFFGDGNGLVTRAGDSLDAWDLVTERKTYSWDPPAQLYRTVISPDARQLIAFGWQGDTLCADLDDGSIRNLALNVPEVSCGAYLPKGGLFAVSSHHGFARVWDTATWHEQVTLRGYLTGLTSLIFSFDGKRLVTGGDNQEALRLWATESWQDVLTLEAQGANFHTLSFSPDGNVIGASNVTGTLQLWRAPSWEEIAASEAQQSETGIQRTASSRRFNQ